MDITPTPSSCPWPGRTRPPPPAAADFSARPGMAGLSPLTPSPGVTDTLRLTPKGPPALPSVTGAKRTRRSWSQKQSRASLAFREGRGAGWACGGRLSRQARWSGFVGTVRGGAWLSGAGSGWRGRGLGRALLPVLQLCGAQPTVSGRLAAPRGAVLEVAAARVPWSGTGTSAPRPQ